MALASELNKGDCINHNGELLKVVRKEVIAVGTHSHTKLKFFMRNIFTGSEKVLTLAHNDKVESVEVHLKQGQIISKQGTKAQVMDNHTYEVFDVEMSEDLTDKLNEGDSVAFIEVNNKRVIIEK